MRLILTLIATLGASSAPAQDASEGGQLFQLHCAVCHGVDATGDGTMAPALTQTPANLATLQERNDGVFPVKAVLAQIDGRDPLLSHGGTMPVYGWFFEGEPANTATASGQPILTSKPMVDILEFLKTIQK